MLYDAKVASGIMDPYYEPRLCQLIQAALTELKTRGIAVEGEFSYSAAVEEGDELPTVTNWTSTVTDDYIRAAVAAYVVAHADGVEPAVKESYAKAYEDTLGKMMGTTGYRRGWEADSDG